MSPSKASYILNSLVRVGQLKLNWRKVI